MNTVLEVILSLLGAFVPPWSALPFVAIIFAVAGWVLRSLWLEQRRLKLESGQALDAARKVFVNSTNAYSNPTDSLRQWATQSELKDTLTARAVNAFLAVREARNPDLTAALSMLDYREAARLNLARSAPNWLLLIGIMGTIVGLSSAVASLAAPVQQALAEGQATIAATGLDATMVEIKRAFACSLWGLIAAVSVAMFTRRVASLQQETLGAVHEFMLSEVSPQILPKSEALQLQQIEQTLREGRNFIERTSNMLEDVSRQMQAAVQGFANTLQTGMQGMQNITTALQQSASSIQNSLTQTAQSAQQSAQQLASSAESLRQSSEKLQEHHTHIANAYEALLNAFKTSRDEMESMVQRQIEKIGEYRSAIERTAQDMMLTLNRVIQALADSQSSYRDARDAVLNSNVEIRTALESAITRFHEAQTEVLKKIGEAQTHASQQLTRIAETLREPLDALTSRLAQLLSDHITTRPQGGDPSEQPAPPTTASPVFTDGELVKTLQKLDQTLQQLAQNATAAPVAPVATPNQQPQQNANGVSAPSPEVLNALNHLTQQMSQMVAGAATRAQREIELLQQQRELLQEIAELLREGVNPPRWRRFFFWRRFRNRTQATVKMTIETDNRDEAFSRGGADAKE